MGGSLLRQYMVFVAALVAALSAAAFAITTLVSRNGLEDLFRSQLRRAEVVYGQYASGQRLLRENELETLLTSPRFLAAVETADPQTVAGEIPTHGALAAADLVCVLDPEGRTLFVSEGVTESMAPRFARLAGPEPRFTTVSADEEVYEVITAPIVANHGGTVGTLAAGRALSSSYTHDLNRLTGFDVVLGLDGRVIGETGRLDRGGGALSLLGIEPGAVARARAGGEELAAYRIEDPVSGLSVTFVGSAGRAMGPIMARVRVLLLGLVVAGSALAMALVWQFTNRRVGRPVKDLVRHSQRIATGDLDFTIPEGSHDELGSLARALERMRADLRRNRDQLDAAHRSQVHAERLAAIGQMAAGIIHDFKSPMAVVLGTADLMAHRHPEDPKLARQCGVIRRQVDRMLGLTRDLLEFVQGKTELEVTTVDLYEWARDVGDAHEVLFRRAGVRLEVRGAEGVRVLMDPDRMRRVVDNLITNAREVSGPGDTVSFRWSRGDRDEVLLEVEDQGPGVPADLAVRIFDPFVTSGKESGSGLGLAISRKIAQDHGATLDLQEAPGGGARFTVRFPQKLYVDDGVPVEEGVAR